MFDPRLEDLVADWLAARPYAKGDLVMVERTVYPKWWQFWKKYERRVAIYEVTGVNVDR